MIKNFNVFFVKVLVVGLFNSFIISASVLATTQDYGIEVQGQASVLVEPDSFALSIAIIETGRFTDKIRMVVDNKSNQVIQAAQGLGVKSKNINSARVSLRVINDKSALTVHGLEVSQPLPNNQKSKVFVGTPQAKPANITAHSFELRRNITVNFLNIKDYDQFLNKVIKIGVQQILPLTMSISNTDKYYQQALMEAISHARTKAKNIANQTARPLGKLVFVKELSRNHYATRSTAMMMSANSVGHNSQVGNQAINASVLVKYAIE